MIYFFLPEIGSQSNWEFNSGDCNIAAFCLSLTICREVSPPRRLCGRVPLPTGGGSVGIDPHHVAPGAAKGTWISVLESCSLLRHMARHFFPWSEDLDVWTHTSPGKRGAGTRLRRCNISRPPCCNEKASNPLLRDLSKYNSQLLSAGVANKFWNEPGKRAVLNKTSPASALLDPECLLAVTEHHSIGRASLCHPAQPNSQSTIIKHSQNRGGSMRDNQGKQVCNQKLQNL